MIRFANLEYLYLIPLVILFFFFALFLVKRTNHKLKKYFHNEMLKNLISSVSHPKRRWKIVFETLTIIFLVFAMARLQIGQGTEKVKNEGIELVLAFDVSKSMLAEDMKPSRLDYAKTQAQRFLEKMGGHKVGLIVFAGNAVLVSPLTPDYSALQMYIDSLSTDSVSTQGTNYEQALMVAENAFKSGGKEEDETTKVTKAIVVFSDGENHQEGALQKANELSEKGIRLFTIGIGTKDGAKIPIRDKFGYLKGFKKDDQGNTIVSKAKTALLKDLASEGQGAYYHAGFGANHIDSIVSDIDRLEKSEFESSIAANYAEYFQIFLIIALIFAFLDLLIGERRAKRKVWQGRFQGEYKK